MDKSVIKKDSLERIKKIHKVSKLLNRKLKDNHKRRLLELMKEHVEEIEELSKKHNRHYLTETGDLIILCFELLLEDGVSIDKTLLRCFKRYETKLPRLI